MLFRYIIICNVANTDIQADILSHTNQLMSLQDLIQFVEAKEAGVKSKISLNTFQANDAIRSSYKKETNRTTNPYTNKYNPAGNPNGNSYTPSHAGKSGNTNRPSKSNTGGNGVSGTGPVCDWCGRIGHGDGSNLSLRARLCPAYGNFCNYCKRYNHFSNVCRSKLRKTKTATVSTDGDEDYHAEDNYEGAVFLSSIQTSTQ